ncbi:MAG: aspartate--tRNA ligase [Candidatus Dadabacteria bacterium]|nr:MAG: aspartate--tRNA ligase [Candidatus Dadabacteria bacterium]
MYRSHTCGELRKSHIGAEVTLSGWIHRKRDHGGILFVDLRDHYGLTQVVFSGSLKSKVDTLRVESVIKVQGEVIARSEETVNTALDTGEIEVKAESFEILSEAQVLPFQIAVDDNAPEALRLKYRFLELRRKKLHDNIILRSDVIYEIRKVMYSLGFHEFQTPILTSSSPEGARDFIVPSRVHPGKFFALPQAPQQFKQLLMVSGFDRYFQIAPCFRDEDPRADRSPGEFYQLDFEMAFVEQEQVFEVCEKVFYEVFTKFSSKKVSEPPFVRIPYNECMESYGTDKPDLRIKEKIRDVTQIFTETEFKVFKRQVEGGGAIKALAFEVDSIPSRKYFDDTVKFFEELSGSGVAYLIFDGDTLKGSISKFVSQKESSELREHLCLGGKAVVFLGAGKEKEILPHMGKLREKVARDLSAFDKQQYIFCFITDYPMYELDEKTGKVVFSHNPFSMPKGGLEALNFQDPLSIIGQQYDVVCNGVELSSGAIRNHSPEIMYRAFEIAGYSREEVRRKFGGMLRAFEFGAPPHGGMAPGIDRIVMLLAEEEAIRDVRCFPLAQTVEDLLMGAPSEVSEEQLREVHIKLDLPDKEKG